MVGIKTLFTQAFPQKIKDYYDAAINNIKINIANTATASKEVTINKKTGVAVFTDFCPSAPSVEDYKIFNNLVTESSYVRISVQAAKENAYASLVSFACANGYIIISINDGYLGNASAPIVTFEVLG
jgi:hypothetical protein